MNLISMAIMKRYVPEPEVKDWRESGGTYYEAICEQCGRIFYPKRSTAKYCSRICNDEHNKGNTLVKDDQQQLPIPVEKASNETQQVLDKEPLAECYKRAKEILKKHRKNG